MAISETEIDVIRAKRIAGDAAQNWGFRDITGSFVNAPDGVKIGKAIYCYYDPDELLEIAKAGNWEAYKGLQALAALYANYAPTKMPAAAKKFLNWMLENDPPKKGNARKLDALVERKAVKDTVDRIVRVTGLATYGEQDASKGNEKSAIGIVADAFGMTEAKARKILETANRTCE
jgi:hypothetical protein